MNSEVPVAETSFHLPSGFKWAGVPAGIKYQNRRDLGLFVTSDGPCNAAAVFTQNIFAAAPVAVSRENLQLAGGKLQGGVVNSGCANAATGEEGMRNARTMGRTAAEKLGLPGDAPFCVCSTGTIGVQLPMEKVELGITTAAAQVAASETAFLDFATSILTTDTCHKIASRSLNVGGKAVRILSCAKGSGMMQPNMATMLAYVFTDVEMPHALLQQCLSKVVDHSLNCMTVDGDTSTNDTTVLLASGASGASISSPGPDYEVFASALLEVLQSISKQLARDGEGASKLIEVEVNGAPDFLSARSCAFKIANSPLVKTAIYGRDANWGRIAMAIGNAGIPFNVNDVTIKLGELTLFQRGIPLPLDEAAALEVLSSEFVRIEAALGAGNAAATVWTCDLTEKYIEINGSYRT